MLAGGVCPQHRVSAGPLVLPARWLMDAPQAGAGIGAEENAAALRGFSEGVGTKCRRDSVSAVRKARVQGECSGRRGSWSHRGPISQPPGDSACRFPKGTCACAALVLKILPWSLLPSAPSPRFFTWPERVSAVRSPPRSCLQGHTQHR